MRWTDLSQRKSNMKDYSLQTDANAGNDQRCDSVSLEVILLNKVGALKKPKAMKAPLSFAD